MGQEQSKKARPVRYLFESLLNMLNMVIPLIYQPTCATLPSVGSSFDSLICSIRNVKRKKYPPIGNQILSPLYIDELIDSSDPRSRLKGLELATLPVKVSNKLTTKLVCCFCQSMELRSFDLPLSIFKVQRRDLPLPRVQCKAS